MKVSVLGCIHSGRPWTFYSENQWWQIETDFWYQMIHSSLIKHNLQPIALKFIYYIFLLFYLTFNEYWFSLFGRCAQPYALRLMFVCCNLLLCKMAHPQNISVDWRRKSPLFSHLRSWRICLRISLSKRLAHHWRDAGCHRSAPPKGLSLYILLFQFFSF